MGQASSTKYQPGNIQKSFRKTFSDPEVQKGGGTALILLGIVTGVMGTTFTAVAFGSPQKSGQTPPATGPCLLVVTLLFFVSGALLVRHRNFGCFKTRNGESETYNENGTLLMFCCFCEKEFSLYKDKNVDILTITKYPEDASACDNCNINNERNKSNSIDLSGSMISFSSLRNFKVHPADVETVGDSVL